MLKLSTEHHGLIASINTHVDDCTYFTKIHVVIVEQNYRLQDIWTVLGNYSLIFPEVKFSLNDIDTGKCQLLDNKFISHPTEEELIGHLSNVWNTQEMIYSIGANDVLTIIVVGCQHYSMLEIYEYMGGKICYDHYIDNIFKSQIMKKFGIFLMGNAVWANNVKRIEIKSEIVTMSFHIIINYHYSPSSDRDINKVKRTFLNTIEKLKVQSYSKGVLCNKMELKKRREFALGINEIVLTLENFKHLCPISGPLKDLVISSILT